jgi:hypothetical protein
LIAEWGTQPGSAAMHVAALFAANRRRHAWSARSCFGHDNEFRNGL